jgi:hypothetical protein
MKLFVGTLKRSRERRRSCLANPVFVETGLSTNIKTVYMADRNNQDPLKDDVTSKGHGRQGIDKAPGEETAQDMQDVVAETQRGKNKVDGDPTQESDQPIEQKRD